MPELTEQDVRRWVGEASFGRSRHYVIQGDIINPRRQGNTLKGLCQGSRPQPYRVEVTVDETGIVGGHCTCPVGDGGRCKHVAALLLTWMQDPSAFVEMEDLAVSLERRSKEELIALMQKMLVRYPDLEMLLELPTPGSSAEQTALDAKMIQRQVQSAFARAGYEWGAPASIASDIQPLLDMGESYVQARDWPNATTLHHTIAHEVLQHSDMIYQDEEGDLHSIVNECVSKLGECLSEETDQEQRSHILRSLFDIYAWDVEHGGIGIGEDAPEIILANTTPEDRRMMAEWVRAAMPAGNSWSDNYHRQVFGRLLLNLGQDEIDDEQFMRICRETGRIKDLVDRLLSLGRVDEAVRETRRIPNDYIMLDVAKIFQQRDYGDQAAHLVRERIASGKNIRLMEWLRAYAVQRHDWGEALKLSEEMFWQSSGMPSYRQVKEVAQQAGRWEQVRKELMGNLAHGNNYSLLVMIHLEEHEPDQALVAMKQGDNKRGIPVGGKLRLQVAQAVEQIAPRDAIQIYLDAITNLINERTRDSYKTAAGYLRRVRDLYHALGEDAVWMTLLTDIRQQNRRLRALQEELHNAGV